MYHASFLDHFRAPRGTDPLSRPTHHGAAEDDACGDRLWLDLRVEAGTVCAAGYRVEGCAGAIALGSALVVLLPGRRLAADAVTRSELEGEVGAVPRAKRHALGLALRALADASR